MAEVPTPTDSTEIELGGKTRYLRYSLATMRRLRKTLGKTIISRDTLLELDEETIPELIFEGLTDKSDFADGDAVAELITHANLKYVLDCFLVAYGGSVPEKNATVPTPAQ